MFLHVCVILFMGGGLPQCMLGYSPARRPPWQGDLPGKADPPGKADHPWQGDRPWQGRPPARQILPCAVHAGRYGQQAGGMHPTGMQFLFNNTFLQSRDTQSSHTKSRAIPKPTRTCFSNEDSSP